MSKLIITEKPSVAKSIASALGASSRADGFYEGSGLIVSWCVGHLVSPLDAGGYDERFKKWRYEDLPILPEPFRYAPIPGKEAALDNVKRLMAREDVTEIVNACDAGREGELIFRLVYEMAGCRKPVLRLWISSMEDSAIREGFSELRPGAEYEALYQSALCRQKADWLVGINATRLFSVLYHRTLNVGRVQTPTLSLLAARDAKIALFHKEKYHLLRLTLDGTEAVSEKFTDPTEAERAAAMRKGATVTCTSVTCEQKKEPPPKLYDLTTLQREANRLFGYTAKQTLDYAQSLYEKKLLTYPRTDSRYLTADMAETASCVIHLAAPLIKSAISIRWWRPWSLTRTYPTTTPLSPRWRLKKWISKLCPWASAICSCWSAASCCVRRRSPMCMRRSRQFSTAAAIPSLQRVSTSSPKAGGRSTAFSAPP